MGGLSIAFEAVALTLPKDVRNVQRGLRMTNSILRLPQVKIKVGLLRSSIYAAVAEKRFPQPIKIGPRACGWLESEIDSWVTQKIETSRGINES